jgi:hypothetical protein
MGRAVFVFSFDGATIYRKGGSMLYMRFSRTQDGPLAVTGKSGSIATISAQGGRVTVAPTKGQLSLEELDGISAFMHQVALKAQ